MTEGKGGDGRGRGGRKYAEDRKLVGNRKEGGKDFLPCWQVFFWSLVF